MSHDSISKLARRAREAAGGLLLLLLCAAPAWAQSALGDAALRLRPGDAVRLAVRDEPELAGDFQLDAAGEVLLPLVGIVRVGARDFEEVRREVLTRYGRELKRSEIQLTPLVRIAVLGEVRQPNLYPVDPTHTLSDVLALAGGLAPTADAARVSLVREGRSIELSMEPGAPALGGQLRSGDQLVVGRRSWYKENAATVLTTVASVAIAVFTTVIVR